jgi:hypothetical protein
LNCDRYNLAAVYPVDEKTFKDYEIAKKTKPQLTLQKNNQAQKYLSFSTSKKVYIDPENTMEKTSQAKKVETGRRKSFFGGIG